MMSSMVGIFLARPFGSKNLMQRIFEVMTEVGKTDRLIKQARKDIAKRYNGNRSQKDIDTMSRKDKSNEKKIANQFSEKIETWIKVRI